MPVAVKPGAVGVITQRALQARLVVLDRLCGGVGERLYVGVKGGCGQHQERLPPGAPLQRPRPSW